MTYLEIHHNGKTLTVTTEEIEVTTMSEPDPVWTYTDEAGHDHWAADGGNGWVRYPTLTRRTGESSWCPECRDMHQDEWWACPQCDEKIVPGSRMGCTRYLPGMVSYEIDGEPVHPSTANAFIESWQHHMDDPVHRPGPWNNPEAAV